MFVQYIVQHFILILILQVNSNMQSSDLDSAFIDAVVTGFR